MRKIITKADVIQLKNKKKIKTKQIYKKKHLKLTFNFVVIVLTLIIITK